MRSIAVWAVLGIGFISIAQLARYPLGRPIAPSALENALGAGGMDKTSYTDTVYRRADGSLRVPRFFGDGPDLEQIEIDLDRALMRTLLPGRQALHVPVARVMIVVRRQNVGVLRPWFVREQVGVTVTPLPNINVTQAELDMIGESITLQLSGLTGLSASRTRWLVVGRSVQRFHIADFARDAGYCVGLAAGIVCIFIALRNAVTTARRRLMILRGRIPPCALCGYQLDESAYAGGVACPECGGVQPEIIARREGRAS